WLVARAWAVGIGPGLVLGVGDDFVGRGGRPGRDAAMLVPELARATTVSVADGSPGPPPPVVHVGGGPLGLLALLDQQLDRRADLRVPALDDDPAWVVRFQDDPS